MAKRLPLIQVRSGISRGSALVSTLIVLVLLTIMVVGLLTILRNESTSARGSRDRQAAVVAADAGLDAAMSSLRGALDPLDSLTNVVAPGFWVSQPGQIVIYAPNGTVSSTVPLYSTNSPGDTNTIDLNQVSWTGVSPIGGMVTTAMPVGFANVLQDPSQVASSNNPLVARYAYWVDDESSKVNLNTADGTAKGLATSYGEGYPTEVSLAALGGTFSNAAPAIVSNAWTRGFNSEAEVTSVGVSTNDYLLNKFNVTVFGKSPEMNFFGEPKIYLMNVASTPNNPAQTGPATNSSVGPYTTFNSSTAPAGMPLTQIYPTSTQLTNFIFSAKTLPKVPAGYTLPLSDVPTSGRGNLPQFTYWDYAREGEMKNTVSPNYPLMLRMAQYLYGYNSHGQAVSWPDFFGNGGSFTNKYNLRQLDSIAYQIADLAGKIPNGDTYGVAGVPYIGYGPLSGQLVCGLSDGPKLTQVLFGVAATGGTNNNLLLKFDVYLEWFMPPQFQGTNMFLKQWNFGGLFWDNWLIPQNLRTNYATLNAYDLPEVQTNGVITGASLLSQYGSVANANSYWANNMLQVTVSGTGAQAGVDLAGNPPGIADPDQVRAKLYHPWTLVAGTYQGSYAGSLPSGECLYSPLAMQFPSVPALTNWSPGQYRLHRNQWTGYNYPTGTNVTSVDISGGLAITPEIGSSWPDQQIDPVPLDAVSGPMTLGDPSIVTNVPTILKAVLPIHITGVTAGGAEQWVHLWVDDPLVNKFPGDWHTNNDATLSTRYASGPVVSSSPVSYVTYTSPSYPGYTTNGSDPGALWLPKQSSAIPKSQRFSSIGLLQYIRPAMMPDTSVTNQPYAQWHGAAWRGLDFGTKQTNSAGVKYPDWALLDLFTVPATPQPVIAAGQSASSAPYRDLTQGGMTAGRINPNGCVICPTNWGITRTQPLVAALQGISVVTYNAGSPSTNTLSASTAQTIAKGIANYIQTNGPLRTVGEIANVPEVAAYVDKANSAGARNDVVRQLVGLMTPRSSTFSVWVVGQSIKKSSRNTQYGIFEPGDQVTGAIRIRYVVERLLDPGASGQGGNFSAGNAGPDGIHGTWDDPTTTTGSNTFQPYNPAYKYRILYAEQINP